MCIRDRCSCTESASRSPQTRPSLPRASRVRRTAAYARRLPCSSPLLRFAGGQAPSDGSAPNGVLTLLEILLLEDLGSLDDSSSRYDVPDEVLPETIRDLLVGIDVEDEQVRVLALAQRTGLHATIDSGGTVDGRCDQDFLGGHLHVQASQRHDEQQVGTHAGPRIVVRRESDGNAMLDERTRVRELRTSQRKHGARHECRNNTLLRQGLHALLAGPDEVIGTCLLYTSPSPRD